LSLLRDGAGRLRVAVPALAFCSGWMLLLLPPRFPVVADTSKCLVVAHGQQGEDLELSGIKAPPTISMTIQHGYACAAYVVESSVATVVAHY
jgi:hypothetical protein